MMQSLSRLFLPEGDAGSTDDAYFSVYENLAPVDVIGIRLNREGHRIIYLNQ